MERFEMAETLSRKAGVSLEEARTALEENDWDLLDAMVALERAHKTAGDPVRAESGPEAGGDPVRPVKNVSRKKEDHFFSNGFAVLLDYFKKLLRITLDNDFEVLHRGKQVFSVPVLVLILLLVLSFGFMLVVLIAGLFCNCRYQFVGRQLGRDSINDAMGKMSDLADDIKESFQSDGDGDGRDGNG